MTKTTYAQKGAAAARKGEYKNAMDFYTQAAIAAELQLDETKAKRHQTKACYYERLAEREAGKEKT